MNKKDKISFLVIIFIGSLIGTISILGLLLLFLLNDKIIDGDDINILDMYIKASFSFFGSIFSIGASLIIFHIQNNRKRKEELLEKNRVVQIIDKSLKDNIKEAKKIYKLISKKGITVFSNEYIQREEEFKELFFTIYMSLDSNSIKSLVLNLDSTSEQDSILIEKYGLVVQIEKILNLLLNQVKTDKAKREILKKIFSIVETIK